MAIQRVTIDGNEIDAVLTERHSESVEITKHPVERGVSPTDHARLQPQKLQVEGVLSNTAATREEQLRRGGESKPGEAGAANTTANALRDLLSARRPVVVSTSTKFYSEMVMTSLEMPRDSRTGDAVRFVANFEQIVFVSTQAIRLRDQLAGRLANPEKPVGVTDLGLRQPIDVTGDKKVEDTLLGAVWRFSGGTPRPLSP